VGSGPVTSNGQGAVQNPLATVSRHLSLVLGERRFRRNGRRWIRAGAGISYIVEIQSSRWNVGNRGSFTLNLGVFVPLACEAAWGENPKAAMRSVDSVIDIRLGEVMPEGRLAARTPRGKGRDYWWHYEATSDFDLLGRDVTESVINYGLSFLDQLDSLAAIHDFLAAETQTPLGLPVQHLYLAAIKVALADPEDARQLLASASERFPAWRARAGGIVTAWVAGTWGWCLRLSQLESLRSAFDRVRCQRPASRARSGKTRRSAGTVNRRNVCR